MRDSESAGAAGETDSGPGSAMLWLGLWLIALVVLVLVERRVLRAITGRAVVGSADPLKASGIAGRSATSASPPPAPSAQADGLADLPAGVHAPITETMAVVE